MNRLAAAFKKGLLYLVPLAVLFLNTQSVVAQTPQTEGTLFWFTVPPLGTFGSSETTLRINSESCENEVTVTSSDGSWTRTLTFSGNNSDSLMLPRNLVGDEQSEVVRQFGFKVESVYPVSAYAYHEAFGLECDATILYPVTYLGTDHYVFSYSLREYDGDLTASYRSEFAIVAPEDNTQIAITLSANTDGGRAAGSTFNITLNEGETYLVRSAKAGGWGGTNLDEDLTGTRVVSTNGKPIAVFGGHELAWVDLCVAGNSLFEHIPPNSAYGSEFVASNTIGRDGAAATDPTMRYRIMAVQNNTNVTIDDGGVITNYTIAAGQYEEYDGCLVAMHITSSAPVGVMQYSKGRDCNISGDDRGDPGMTWISPVTNMKCRSSIRFMRTVTANNFGGEDCYLMLHALTSEINNITWDGNVIAGWAPIGTSGYSYVRFLVPNPDALHELVSTTGEPNFIAYTYGLNFANQYMINMGSGECITTDSLYQHAYVNPDTNCINTDFTFTADGDQTITDYFWDFGDGSAEVEGDSVMHAYAAPGDYTIVLRVERLCNPNGYDTVYVHVEDCGCQIATSGDTLVCVGQGATLQLDSTDAVSYTWDSGETTPTITVMDSGWVSIEGVANDGMTCSDSMYVAHEDCGCFIDISGDTTVCTGDIGSLVATGEGVVSYQWSTGDTTNQTTYSAEGFYSVIGTDSLGNTCVDTFQVTVVIPTVDAGPDFTICERDQVQFQGSTNGTAQWMPATGLSDASVVNPMATASQTREYVLTNSIGECTISDTMTLYVIPYEDSLCSTPPPEYYFYAPNAFSPNNDGQNDEFVTKGVGVVDYEFYIFDRWGELIFESTDMHNTWDGTYQGSPVQIGVYVWKAIVKDPFNKKHRYYGHVSVVR